MGGGDRLKASRAGNGGVGSASNGSKTAPTSKFGLPELPLPQSLRKGTVTSPLSNDDDDDDDDDDVYYSKGRRPREDEEGEESYEKQRQRPDVVRCFIEATLKHS